MKIALADNNARKFTNDIIEHWERLGHEVRYEPGASEHLAQWADVYYCDTWDNNVHYLWKLYNGDEDHNRTEGWDNSKKPIVVCRVLDWEAWIGRVRDQRIIDWVDKIIFIAPHIQKRVNREVSIPEEKQQLIRPGVNLEKFTLKTKETDGFQLGMVLGDMWWPKNHMAGLDIFTSLYQKDNRWRLHIRGQHEGGNDFWKEMYEYYLDSRGIRDVVTLYPYQDPMNDWYENIDILLHPGMKEAFCYAVGEAMAKGIPVVVNDFMGSHDIWPHWAIYQTNEQAVTAIKHLETIGRQEWGPKTRDFIESTYSLSQMLTELDVYLNI